MAALLGVSWPILQGWCNEIEGFDQSGAFERGAQGMEYQFCPVRTVWFLIEHFKAEVDRLTAVKEQIIGPAAVEIIGDAAIGMTPEELNKSLAVAERIEDWKIRQGLLVDAEKARSDFRNYHMTLQATLLASAQRQDPDGTWPPAMRVNWDAAIRQVMVDAQRAREKCFPEIAAKAHAA